jgi:UDP-N-acetylmuramyl pentapeptide phosphotransferase/UDP-N-acetylglucosamine-1-phosphate transferase
MIEIITFSLFSLIIINFFFKKINFVDDRSLSRHKISKPNLIPLSGGFFLGLSFVIINLKLGLRLDYFFFYFLIIILGIASDQNFINSPLFRFFLQIIITFFFIIFFNIKILNTKIPLLDFFLENSYLNYTFVLLFILVIINGSNFIDGLNGYLLYQFIAAIFAIIFISYYLEINLQKINSLYFYLLPLLVFYFFNLFGKNFLGDSGSYFLGFFFTVELINFININNNQISPVFILFLLWYIAFEVLFSIIRRILQKKKLYVADKYHLHTIFYIFLKKKYHFKNSNSIAGITLNCFFLPSYIFGIFFHYSSPILTFVIICNIIIYTLLYTKIIKKIKNDK